MVGEDGIGFVMFSQGMLGQFFFNTNCTVILVLRTHQHCASYPGIVCLSFPIDAVSWVPKTPADILPCPAQKP